jgi:hypothetical protein
MKKLITTYTFDASASSITITDYALVELQRLLLITNVTQNTIIYNFADSTKGATISGGNTIILEADTSAMADTDSLQIFYDVENEVTDLARGYSTGVSGVYTATVPIEMQNVGGRAVDMTAGFYPNYDNNDAAVFNFDKENGGALTYQADLDKDIDSVTTFDVGYGSVSNYTIGTMVGTAVGGIGTQVAISNSNRITILGQNLGTVPIFVKYGLGCNSTSFNFILYPGINTLDGRGEKFSDDRYKGDISVNTTTGATAQYIFWEGV